LLKFNYKHPDSLALYPSTSFSSIGATCIKVTKRKRILKNVWEITCEHCLEPLHARKNGNLIRTYLMHLHSKNHDPKHYCSNLNYTKTNSTQENGVLSVPCPRSNCKIPLTTSTCNIRTLTYILRKHLLNRKHNKAEFNRAKEYTATNKRYLHEIPHSHTFTK